MSKNTEIPNPNAGEPKPAAVRPAEQIIQEHLGIGLTAAHSLATLAGATVVKQTNNEIKFGAVDALPEVPKEKK